MKHFIADHLDHRHLNDILPYQTSAERVAEWLFAKSLSVLEPSIGNYIIATRVSETPNTWAEFRP